MIFHTSMTKAYLIKQIRRYGARAMLEHVPEGASDADVLQAIADHPQECFVIGKCNHRSPDGSCAGHPSPSLPQALGLRGEV